MFTDDLKLLELYSHCVLLSVQEKTHADRGVHEQLYKSYLID